MRRLGRAQLAQVLTAIDWTRTLLANLVRDLVVAAVICPSFTQSGDVVLHQEDEYEAEQGGGNDLCLQTHLSLVKEVWVCYYLLNTCLPSSAAGQRP